MRRVSRLRGRPKSGARGLQYELRVQRQCRRAVRQDDGPVDAGLRARLLATAKAALAIIAGFGAPAPKALSVGGAEPGCAQQSQRLHVLEALLEAGNTRALDHLPWLEGWVDTKAPGEARELLRQIEALDFPAALATLRGLAEGGLTSPR